MIVHHSLPKSRNVLGSLLRIFFDTEVIPSLALNFKLSSIISSYIPTVVVIAKNVPQTWPGLVLIY